MSTDAEIFRGLASGLLRQMTALISRIESEQKRKSLTTVTGTLQSLIDAVSEDDFKKEETKDSEIWTTEDRKESFQHGWGLFSNDNGELEIHGLDDPEGVCEDLEVESLRIFKGSNRDRKAAKFVQEQAEQGNATCRKAIELLIEQKSSDVKRFKLKKTWD